MNGGGGPQGGRAAQLSADGGEARRASTGELSDSPVLAAADPPSNASAPTSATAAQDAPQFDKLGVIGNALWLMCQSAAHKHLFLADLDWMLVPPVALHQFRLWRRNNLPVTFASWAFLSREAEERVRIDIRNLREDDWNSGDQAWLIDLVAPFGGGEEAVRELKEKILVGRSVKTLRPAPGGKGFAVVEW